ncbi:MAG: Ig-like domain-containing protein [Anaerocolumna sp.]
MPDKIIDIESVSTGFQDKVKQSLAFKTGKFVWRIKFNIPLNPATINNKNLYVTTLNLVPLMTYIRYDTVNKYIEIEPLEPYAENESYILNISKNVQSQGGKNLKSPVQVQFKL